MPLAAAIALVVADLRSANPNFAGLATVAVLDIALEDVEADEIADLAFAGDIDPATAAAYTAVWAAHHSALTAALAA
jgi:hypothetical protein